ncbi:hypothetical protein AH845_004305 [Salmonella enterica subsp. enterica]|nr:hypothetical protein [Salmonella enterica subsp. enterica]
MEILKNMMLRTAVELSLRSWQLRRRISLWLSGMLLSALASRHTPPVMTSQVW